MIDESVLSGLPLDVYSRLESLFFHVRAIKNRVNDPIYGQLVDDFESMAIHFMTRWKAAVRDNPDAGDLISHEAVDKLTREWQSVLELIARVGLGDSYLRQFQPYLQQATKDIGLSAAEDRFILIPTFGEYFALTRFEYSSMGLAMLKLPLAALNAPWEWSVIWHEVAGLKVQKVKDQLRDHWQAYASKKGVAPPSEDENRALFNTLFERILTGEAVDGALREKLQPVLRRAIRREKRAAFKVAKKQIWPLDWLEQLFEDACSVLAFGEDFLFTFEKILSRSASKLNADREHPDLATRLQVANRLLALRNSSAAATTDPIERMTDELLWSFIQAQDADSDGYLPVAFEKPGDLPEIRRQLIDIMCEFRNASAALSPYPDPLQQKVQGLLGGDRLQGTPIQPFVGQFIQNDPGQKLDQLIPTGDLNALLKTALSQTDDFDIRWHGSGAGHGGLSINVHNQDHAVYVAVHV